ncbi:MAG: STAS domain-containing protein [Candidatus Riflebacteria bacterium]|nr:STAS domain-containing protein [Candidatus Riflebacteria bacterium]
MSNFELLSEMKDGIQILKLSGYLGPTDVKNFESEVMTMLREKKNYIIMDFSNCSIVTSPGIAKILELSTKIEEVFFGRLAFTGLDKLKIRTFTIAGLLPSIPNEPGLSEAIEDMKKEM